MTTDEDRLIWYNAEINDEEAVLEDSRRRLHDLRTERAVVQQRIRAATPEYQLAQRALRSAAQEPRETAAVDRREDT